MSDDKTDALLDSTLRDVYHVVIKPMQLEIADLTKQLAECEKENSEYVEIHRRLESHDDKWEAEYKQKITSIESQLAASERENADLRIYASHTSLCKSRGYIGGICDCGLDKALQESGNE